VTRPIEEGRGVADATSDERLRRAFDFSAEDLEINRLGRLTARQEAALSALRASRRQRTALALGVIGLAIIIPVILLMSGLIAPRASGGLSFFGITAALIVAFFFFGEIADFWRGRDLRAGWISQVEGEAALSTAPEVRVGRAYFVRIDQARLRAPTRKQWEAFDEGKRYRVFYIDNPPAHVILSVEPLDE
jgi:hypothetical protein